MISMPYTDIEFHMENQIATITLARPEKLNAIRIHTYKEIISALQVAEKSPECHVILLTGKGNTFCAGNDLLDLVEGDPQEVMECVQGIFQKVAGLTKVLVAAVEGVAVGIGTTLLLHCDIVTGAKNCRFRLPFANLGVCPEGGSSVLLPQAIGQKAAREVLLTGRFFDAEEAIKWGLLTKITEPGEAERVAMQTIDQLLQQPLQSLLATKKLLRCSLTDVNDVVAAELEIFSNLLQSKETQKRIGHLLGKTG